MEVNAIPALVILFLIIGIVFSLNTDLLSEIRDTQDNDVSDRATNQTVTWTGNNTAITLEHDNIVENTFVLYNNGSEVKQGVNSVAGNYTVNSTFAEFYIFNSSPSGKVGFQSEWVTNKLNVTYSYFIGSAQRNASAYGLKAQINFAKWSPTIALVVIIAIIIGVILFYIGRRINQN